MGRDFQKNIKKYAEVAIQVGLNLQPGQKLIIQAIRRGGVSLETAPAVRELVSAAYQAGASTVEVLWRDEQIRLKRYLEGPSESIDDLSPWQTQAVLDVIESGGAMLTILGLDPSLLEGQDPDLVARERQAIQKMAQPIREHIGKNAMNWMVLAIPVPGWARKVFPDLTDADQIPALWNALFEVCRIYDDDPIGSWQKHLADLDGRAKYLNKKSYTALHYSAPGTDLQVGLPAGHVWRSAGFKSQTGIPFTANIPTEEVFTLPDKRRIEGTVQAARPLVYSNNIIDNFSLMFNGGRVVDFSAERGEKVLENMLNVDENASMLGEVALVPNSSPVSQSRLLFYSTLLDENASSHLALGSAYRFSLEDGEKLTAEEFDKRGGNSSLIHVDFMIGSEEMDISGELPDGKQEPIMKSGEWVY